MSEAVALSIGFGRGATQKLTHVGLTLAPRRGRGRWLVVPLLVAAAAAAGLALGHTWREPVPAVIVQRPAPAAPELPLLRRELEEARLGLRLADARSHELERQIDTLNQKLTESQDQLTFYRKAREGRH